MADFIHVEIEGLDKIKKNLEAIKREFQETVESAGNEAAKTVLKTRGLQLYPPETAANKPPTPFYIRGRGTQLKSLNTMTSQRLGSQWTVKSTTNSFGFTTTIGNRATYAEFIHGEKQVRWAGPRGWLKLYDTAKEKLPEIVKIYNAWIQHLIHKHQLD